jgi:alkanesulfonate monooxygenase SsuD/methylene tetrahydromethanopterin reductase-like flavin-dependent oxidoreductase (luciferase family)
MGPKNVEMIAELAEGWEPIFYFPERAAGVWDGPLAAGRARRDPALPPLDVVAQAGLAIGEDVTGYLDLARPMLALYIGGMGPHRDRGSNFYYELAVRYGFGEQAAKVQDAYLDGRKDEAAALVPAELLAGTSLVGPAGQPRRPRPADRKGPRPGRLTEGLPLRQPPLPGRICACSCRASHRRVSAIAGRFRRSWPG